MKTKARQLVRKALGLLTALSLSATMFILPVTSTLKVNAGLVTNVITGKWSAIAMGAIERGVIFGVSKAKSATQNDGMYQVLRWTQRILAGNSGLVASDTLAAVKQIQAELDALVAYTKQSSGEIEKKLNELETMELQQIFKQNYYNAVFNFSNGYNTMLSDFNDFFNAFANYAKERENNPEADTSTLKLAYLNLLTRYHNKDVSNLFVTPLIGDAQNRGFLSTISPYDQTQRILTNEDVYDPATWGNTTGLLTGDSYLEAFYNYITHVSNFESNVHSQMRSAANFAADAAYKYIQAYRYYVEFESMLISAESTDPDLAQTNVQAIWDRFINYSNMAQRGLNQMVYLHKEVFDSFMRDYDVDTTLTIGNYQSEQLLFNAFMDYINANGGKNSEYDSIDWSDGTDNNDHGNYKGKSQCYTNTKMTVSKITSANQKAYQFKLVSETDNRAYAIRQSGNGNEKFYGFDLTCIPLTSVNKPGGTTISLDALNLLKNTSNGFYAPKNVSEFSAVTSSSNPVYPQDGLMTEYLTTELVFAGFSTPNLPQLDKVGDNSKNAADGPNYVLLKTPLIWNESNSFDNMLKNHDMSMTLANASMHSMPSTGVVDLEATVREPHEKGTRKNKEMLVMYTGAPKEDIDLSTTDGGSTYFTVTSLAEYLKGNSSQTRYTSKQYLWSGDVVDLAFRPNEGMTVTKVQLQDSQGNVLEDLLSDSTVYYDPNADVGTSSSGDLTESYTVSAQEQFEDLIPDSEGYRHFLFPFPYHSCKLVVTYEKINSALLTYPCQTHDLAENNQATVVMQYGGYDYLAQKEFHAGEMVDIITTGYNGYIADGIYLTDESGNRLDIEVVETTNTTIRVSPTERSFCFIMPDQAVHVYPTQETAYEVTVYDNNSSHTFDLVKCFDFINLQEINSWQTADSVPFAQNGRVDINIKADNGFFIKNISVIDNDNRVPVPCINTNEGIRFTMPAGSVAVKVETEPIDIEKFVARIEEGSAEVIHFVDSGGNEINASSLQIGTGEEVSFRSSIKTISILDSNGSEVSYEPTGDDSYRFIMPASNVELKAELYVASIKADSRNRIQFVDENNVSFSETTIHRGGGTEVRFYFNQNDCHEILHVLDSAGSEVAVTAAGNQIYHFIMPAANVEVSYAQSDTPVHQYQNGFCRFCDHYETPEKNADGEYEIRNGGNLFWMASMMNDDHTKADFTDVDYSAAMVLTDDIDLENRQWIPMTVGTVQNPIKFRGHLNGNGHTIRGFYMNISGLSYYPSLLGVCEDAIVENVSLKGNMTGNEGLPMIICPLTNSAGNSTFSHVYNYVDMDLHETNTSLYVTGLIHVTKDCTIDHCINFGNITSNQASFVAGLVNTAYSTKIDRCVNFGNINIPQASYVAGLVYWMQEGGWILNSANIGNITVNDSCNVSGILKNFCRVTDFTFVANCYNYGQLGGMSHPIYYETEGSGDLVIRHCYYLEGSANETSSYGEAKSAESFASGEVAYLLNTPLEDNGPAWYQDIDNGKGPDAYPLPDEERGMVYYIDAEDRYSNYPEDVPATVTVSMDTDQFIYDESGNATSYLTFDSTGTSDPVTVEQNSEVIIRYTTDDTHTLASVTAIGQTSGQQTTLTMDNGTITCPVTEEDLLIVPDFEEIELPVTVSMDTDQFIYDESGNATSYLTFDSTGTSDPVTVDRNSEVIIRYTTDDTHTLTSVTAIGQTSGEQTTLTMDNGTISCPVTEEDLLIVPVFEEIELPVTVSMDTDQFIYDESGNATSYLTFDSTGTSDPVTVDRNSEVIIRYTTDDTHTLTSVTAIGQTSGEQTTLTMDNGTISCPVTEEDLLIVPVFEEIEQPAPDPSGISTYEELVAFAEKVNNDYAHYGSMNVFLANNIIAPEDSSWTLAIGSEEQPFNGTFDGNGYVISGLKINIADNGGLFGSIGPDGLVKDLAVVDCSFVGTPRYAGGIAAVNNGTIDHCLSGITPDSRKKVYTPDGKSIVLDRYNSSVTGELCGGIAAVNNGTITGTRSGAYVYGKACGGLAGENNGVIYGCANNGPVGKNSVQVQFCGGLVCTNNGKIASSYNSGLPTTLDSSKTSIGMIAALSKSGDITNVFCYSVNGIPAAGTMPEEEKDAYVDISGKVTVLDNTTMLDSSFADTLNEVTDDTVQWGQKVINNTYLNCHYPVILGNFLKNRTLSLNNGISVSGLMHQSLNVSYSALPTDSEQYTAFRSAVPTGLTTVYGVSCDDGKGNFIPEDYWCSGVSICVPVDSDNVMIAVMGTDGTVRTIKPDSVTAGKAYFTAASPVSFAVIKTTSSGDKPSDPGSQIIPVTDTTRPAATGEGNVLPIVLMGMLLSAAVILSVKRKKNHE